MEKSKDTKIQHCQNLLENIEECKKGLASMVPEPLPDNYQLDDLMIGWDCEFAYDKAEAINDDFLQKELERAHNYYVAILERLKELKGTELAKLLTENNN